MDAERDSDMPLDLLETLNKAMLSEYSGRKQEDSPAIPIDKGINSLCGFVSFIFSMIERMGLTIRMADSDAWTFHFFSVVIPLKTLRKKENYSVESRSVH